MFAERFLPLINSFPNDADALRRVANYFEDLENRQGERVFKVRLHANRLFDISQAGSTYRLARLIQILLDANLLERRLIVRSPLGGGVEYRSHEAIPSVVLDPLRDVEMDVTEENLEASYVVVANGSN